jgi:hypothetical protein
VRQVIPWSGTSRPATTTLALQLLSDYARSQLSVANRACLCYLCSASFDGKHPMRIERGGSVHFQTSLCPLPLINIGSLDRDWYEVGENLATLQAALQKLQFTTQCSRVQLPTQVQQKPAGTPPQCALCCSSWHKCSRS